MNVRISFRLESKCPVRRGCNCSSKTSSLNQVIMQFETVLNIWKQNEPMTWWQSTNKIIPPHKKNNGITTKDEKQHHSLATV